MNDVRDVFGACHSAVLEDHDSKRPIGSCYLLISYVPWVAAVVDVEMSLPSVLSPFR